MIAITKIHNEAKTKVAQDDNVLMHPTCYFDHSRRDAVYTKPRLYDSNMSLADESCGCDDHNKDSQLGQNRLHNNHKVLAHLTCDFKDNQ